MMQFDPENSIVITDVEKFIVAHYIANTKALLQLN